MSRTDEQETNAELARLNYELGLVTGRIEQVRELRARRGRDLSPETRAEAEQLQLTLGQLMAILLSVYAQGHG